MFTGLVEAVGVVAALQQNGPGVDLIVEIPNGLADGEEARIGESVALNGCCLTIVSRNGNRWTFQAGAETLSRTNLGTLSVGDPLNIERSLRAGDRLGGHIVQGHIDGVGRVASVLPDGDWTTMRFSVSAALTRQMVPKGSVAVDGVSLTLVDVERTEVSVALIPHTLKATTLGRRRPGDAVNIETDIIGKYMDKMLGMIGRS